MSKLSSLEKSELAKLYKLLAPVKNSDNDNSDNINDFIFEQIEVSVKDKGDLMVLASARKHFEIENAAMKDAFDIVERLVEHFDC